MKKYLLLLAVSGMLTNCKTKDQESTKVSVLDPEPVQSNAHTEPFMGLWRASSDLPDDEAGFYIEIKPDPDANFIRLFHRTSPNNPPKGPYSYIYDEKYQVLTNKASKEQKTWMTLRLENGKMSQCLFKLGLDEADCMTFQRLAKRPQP